MTKLSNENVQGIKNELSAKLLTQREIGDKYGVSRSVISDIACGRVHKEVKADLEMSEQEAHIFKLQSEIEHLREERNTFKRQLRNAAKTQGLFQAIVDELDDRVKPMRGLPSARPEYKPSKDVIVEHLVMHLSDGHHDQVITPDDTGPAQSGSPASL